MDRMYATKYHTSVQRCAMEIIKYKHLKLELGLAREYPFDIIAGDLDMSYRTIEIDTLFFLGNDVVVEYLTEHHHSMCSRYRLVHDE